jgi:type II secretory pathway component HofQ
LGGSGVKISIRSMRDNTLKSYKELLEKKVDFDKHYTLYNSYESVNYYNQEDKTMVYLYELKDVEVNTIEELFDIFSEFEAGMGEGYGHITIDVKNNIVYILDHWIE